MATDPQALVDAARGWIGTPYVHQASLKGAGCDCLGLLRGVWREVVGVEPEQAPAYSRDWAESNRGSETLRDALARYLDPIGFADLHPGDVVLFRMVAHGPAKHCGVLASDEFGLTLIHARQDKRVSEERFSIAWRHKLAFAFRVR